MKRSGPLRRTVELMRYKRINIMSRKQRARLERYFEVKTDALLAADYRCQAKLDGCSYWAAEVHHMRGRVGADLFRTLLAICRQCHRYLTLHPEEAYALGLSKRRVP